MKNTHPKSIAVVMRTPPAIQHPTKRHENQTKGKVGHNTKDKQEIPQNNKDQNKRKIIIAGDSIIQHVHGWELSNENCNVAVKSFSGSKIEDMQDYLRPLIRRKPDEIVLHIGTNNIRDSTSDPQTLADGIANLADLINSSSPSTQISISGLVTQRDNSTFVSKINNTKKRLKAICISIDNSNVNLSCLNRRGLHLNRNGSSLLSRNFLNHISN